MAYYMEGYKEENGVITGVVTGRTYQRQQTNGRPVLLLNCIGECRTNWLSVTPYTDGLCCPLCGGAITPFALVWPVGNGKASARTLLDWD